MVFLFPSPLCVILFPSVHSALMLVEPLSTTPLSRVSTTKMATTTPTVTNGKEALERPQHRPAPSAALLADQGTLPSQLKAVKAPQAPGPGSSYIAQNSMCLYLSTTFRQISGNLNMAKQKTTLNLAT